MNVDKFTPFEKASYYTGFRPDFKKFVPSNFIDHNDEKPREYEKIFDEYVKNLEFTYPEYLKLIESCNNDLTNPYELTTKKISVINKLEEMAKEHIKNEEITYGRLYTLILRVISFFQGHWGHTTGEWGLKLASQFHRYNDSIALEKNLKCLITGNGAKDDLLKECAEEANTFDDEQFKQLLRNAVFGQEHGFDIGDRAKMKFYDALNAEKQQIFIQELQKCHNWFEEAVSIVEFSEVKKIKSFIPALIPKFIAELKQVAKIAQFKQGLFHKVINTFAAEAVRSLMNEQKFSSIESFHEPFDNMYRIEIPKSMFDEEETKVLKDKVRDTALFHIFELPDYSNY